MNDFLKLLNNLGINPTEDQLSKLNIYYEYLIEYNNHTNITRITSKEDVYLKHFYDSLTILKVMDLNSVNNLLDIGSGAGFPGMVIKIFFPNINVTLLDSNGKKCNFLKSLAEKLNICVDIINKRVEDLDLKFYNSFDIVTSRAVAFIDIISSLSLPFIKKNGKVVLYKGNLEKELEVLENHFKELGINDYNVISVSYFDNIRNIIVLKKDSITDNKISYSQIIKKSKKWND